MVQWLVQLLVLNRYQLVQLVIHCLHDELSNHLLALHGMMVSPRFEVQLNLQDIGRGTASQLIAAESTVDSMWCSS